MAIDIRIADGQALRQRERAGYDRVAQSYSANAREDPAGWRRRMIESACLAPGERVLDLCTGPGWLAIDAARAVAPGGRVIAADLSEGMCAMARRNAAEAGVSVEVRQMDAEQLELPSASLDAVLCSLGLMHVPDPYRAVSEMARVLRPGGRASAVVWASAEETFVGPLARALRAAAEPLPIDYEYVSRLGQAPVLEEIFGQAGFQHVDVRGVAATMQLPDAGAFWDSFGAIGGLFGSLVDGLTAEGRDRARGAFVAEAEALRRPGERVVLPANRMVVSAQK